MSIFSVRQLVRQGIHDCVLLAFSAFTLWPALASAEEGGSYVLRGPRAQVKPSQWFDATQDNAPDQDEAAAYARQAIDGDAARPVASLPLSAWVVTPGDARARDQFPFLTPYRSRAPPWTSFLSIGTTLFERHPGDDDSSEQDAFTQSRIVATKSISQPNW
jgi:hypothetical protein